MSAAFKGGHFAPDVILLCMRWYCRYALSYRDLEEMMAERHLSVNYTTIRGFEVMRMFRKGQFA